MRFAHQVIAGIALLCAAGLLLAAPADAVSTVPPTPGALTAHNISAAYVAGVSSGGYMAGQLHVAYSGTFKGAAIFSAGPYYCAQDGIIQALLACTNTFLSDQLASLEQDASTWSSQGLIDPISKLSGQPVWVFHGTNDTTVRASVTDDLVSFYRHFGANVTVSSATPAGHAWVSPFGPNACSVTASPYVNNCGTDPERELLGVLLGAAVNAPNTGQLTGQLTEFSQDTYAPNGQASSVSMGSTGYVYTPASCAAGSPCRLLVALHGCLQSSSAIQLTFVDDANLNQYADTNNIVVLYPQAAPTSLTNPNACWDWWGYLGASDANYARHGGAQLETIMRIVHALGG